MSQKEEEKKQEIKQAIEEGRLSTDFLNREKYKRKPKQPSRPYIA